MGAIYFYKHDFGWYLIFLFHALYFIFSSQTLQHSSCQPECDAYIQSGPSCIKQGNWDRSSLETSNSGDSGLWQIDKLALKATIRPTSGSSLLPFLRAFTILFTLPLPHHRCTFAKREFHSWDPFLHLFNQSTYIWYLENVMKMSSISWRKLKGTTSTTWQNIICGICGRRKEIIDWAEQKEF